MELKRTCTRCGRDWYLPAGLRPRKQAKMVGWLTPIIGKKRQAIRAEQALVDASNRQLAELARCPNCGSGAYSEERVSITT